MRLPTELLDLLKVTLGDKLSVNILPDGVLLKAARRSFTLNELLAQCDPSAPEPVDMAAWSRVKPVAKCDEPHQIWSRRYRDG